MRPTQCSSFMSRPGLRCRVRWGEDSDTEPGVGQRPCWGEGARFVPPGLLDRLRRTVPKIWCLVLQKRRSLGKWRGEVRGADCPWGSVLPPAWVPWGEVWLLSTPLLWGAGESQLLYPTPLSSLAFPWVCPGRMKLCPTPLAGPSVLPPRACEERSGSVSQASSPGVLAA